MGSTLLHPNHFLLIRMKEKLIQLYKKQQATLMIKGASSSKQQQQEQDHWEEIRSCVEQQVEWFSQICDVMVKVDPPADVWTDTLNKLKRDLDQVQERYSAAIEYQ